MHNSSYELKKGVLIHAFFDGSGLALYDSENDNTVHIRVSQNELREVLNHTKRVNNDGYAVQIIQQLLNEKMISLVQNKA